MTKRPRFSIVIPCYNEASYIAETLRSIQRQDFKGEYEVIVVDNNCTDNTTDIAIGLGAKVITAINPGVCCARQAGTEAARGDVIISTDADTTFSSGWLAQIDETFKNNKHCVAVGGPCLYVNGPWWAKPYCHLLFGMMTALYRVTGRPFYITATNTAFLKSAWTGYETWLTQGGDELDLLRKLKRKGKVIFDNKNSVYTSSRRLTKGLFYSLFVSLLMRYLIEYSLSKLLKRPILGTAPAFRASQQRQSAFLMRGLLFTIFLAVLAIFPTMRTEAVHEPDRLMEHIVKALDEIV